MQTTQKIWDPTKSNYNKRGDDLRVKFDPSKIDDPKLAAIANNIIDLSVPRGKQKALDAKVALNKPGWQKWMSTRHQAFDRIAELKRSCSIAGNIVDMSEFERREFINECYEEYLRMAQMSGRSQTTHIKVGDKIVGKLIIEMSFEDYLNDCVRNLDWRIKKDLPELKHREEMGYIGIVNSEYDKTAELLKKAKDAIRSYLSLNEKERFLYV